MTVEMPHDIDAEKAVLGAALLDPRCLVDIVPEVAPDDFFHPANRAVCEAVYELDRKSHAIDAVSVADWMRSAATIDRLRAVNGADYLTELLASVVTVANVAHHARSVARKSERRRWVLAAVKLRDMGLAAGDDAEFLQAAERELMALTARKRAAGPMAVKGVLNRVVKTLENRYEKRNEHAITGIASGLHALDALTQGWQRSDLIIVAGRPSMGKTALAMSSAVEAARAGVPVLFFSLEMSAESLIERVVAMEGNVDSSQLRSGQINPATWVRLSGSFGRISDMPI